MNFYERFEALCKSRGMSPQSKKILDMLKVTSPTVTGWKGGSLPKVDVLLRIAQYFDVTTDYLLGNDDIKKEIFDILDKDNPLSQQEITLIGMFRKTTEEGRLKIIQSVMNICDDIQKNDTGKNSKSVG